MKEKKVGTKLKLKQNVDFQKLNRFPQLNYEFSLEIRSRNEIQIKY
jgi:hypothetical protein